MIIPLEHVENIEVSNDKGEIRLIGYNNGIASFIGCYYIKDKQLRYAGDTTNIEDAYKWLSGDKNINLLT